MAQKAEQFKDTLQVLISSCGDKEDFVNTAIIKSLTRLASVYPNEVVEQFCEFYKTTETNKNTKINVVQLGNIIKVIEQTCVNHMKAIKPELPPRLVETVLKAMTASMDYEPTVQMGASSVLVAVGHVHLDLVLQSLIGEITTVVPHYTVPHTLGTLAAVNTTSIVPFVKDILSKMLPLLGTAKAEGVKQAFAYAFGHFAVAVSEQIGDNVENDNITSIKDNFVVEFTLIFDVLYNQWLHSYEPKVSETVLEALGPITRLISERKFDETLNKFVLSMLGLYRKQTINSYYVSQCISYLLTPSPLNPKLSLNDNVISATNHTLFGLVLLEPDYDQPQTVKNHFEVLRCFDHMAGQFSDQTIEGLLHQLKNNNEKDRMRAVIILTHLTTSSQVFIERFAEKFITQLKVMTNMEPSVKMKKLLAKAIVGLVYRNCVSADDFQMVDFIVKHCGFEPPNITNEEVNDLHDTCRSSLVLMCNSATVVRGQLLQLLLRSMTTEEMTSSMSTVAYCLSSLLQNNSDAAEGNTNPFENKISPDLVFVRCITYLAEPDKVERNKNILTFLEEYSGDIHKNLKNSFSIEVGRLLKYVKKNEPNDEWHDMLLSFLVSAIDEVNNDKWAEGVATILSNQVVAAKQPPMVKGLSLQYLAVLTCHITNAAAVEKVLKIIMLALKSVPFESVTYVSKAVGLAARQHGEYILNELDAAYKDLEGRRGNKLLNFISSRHSKSEAEINVLKYAVIVCYGEVAAAHPDVVVLTRLSDNVTNIIYEILKSCPPMDLCRASVTTLHEIGSALLPSPHHNVVLRNRWQLLNAVLEQIFNANLERRNVELYPIIVKASMALTKLQKGILPEERNTILRVLFNSIFGELSSFKKKYDDGNGEENDKLAKTLNDSLTLLHDLIRELIIQSTCLSTLDDLIGLLVEWLRSDNDEIRTASILVFQVIFDTYIKNVKLNYETPSKFGQMGYLLGLIVPGIADTSFPVRLTTVDCIKIVIQIEYLYDGHVITDDDECIVKLTALQNDILTNDLEMISEYCATLTGVISEKIPHLHTMQFVESLLEGYEGDEMKTTGISSVLNEFFNRKGQELYQSIERIMEVVIRTMDLVEGSSEKLLRPLTSLAKCHTNAVTAVLLAQRVPLKRSVILCWRHLACDPTLAPAIIDNFLRLMGQAEMYEDPYHITDRHIAALQPMTLLCALSEMLQESQLKDTCVTKFAELFAVLYTSIACYLDAEPPAYCVPTERKKERIGIVPNREALALSPSRICIDAFLALLQQAECYKVKEAVSLSLSIEHGDSTSILQELVPALSSAVCRSCPQHLAKLVTAVAGYAQSPLPPQRAAAVALLADFLRYRCNNNPVLTETVLATLRAAWTDSHPLVLSVSLLAVGSIAALSDDVRASVLPAALAALSQAIDAAGTSKPSESVPLSGMLGLSRLLSGLNEAPPRELLAAAQKIRPFMSTDCGRSRERALRLFGIIASKVQSPALVEQAISSLPCFLLHLCDANQAVVRASKFTLKQIFKTFNTPRSNEFIQTHLPDDGRLYLEEFLTALLRSLANEMPASIAASVPTAVGYLNTPRDDLKPYAPLLVGKLFLELHAINDSNQYPLDDDVTSGARARLLALLKASEPQVRGNAAVALTHLCLVAGQSAEA